MNNWRMFIDDERYPADKDKDMFIVRTVEEAIDLISNKGMPTFISFDHDLGDNIPSGFDLAKWIVEQDLDKNGAFIPTDFTYYVHSQNPQGKKNIEGLLNQYLDVRYNSNKPKNGI